MRNKNNFSTLGIFRNFDQNKSFWSEQPPESAQSNAAIAKRKITCEVFHALNTKTKEVVKLTRVTFIDKPNVNK